MSRKDPHNFSDILLLGDLVKTFIGPLRRIKCLEDGNRSRFFRHASLLLEQLDVEHPVYQYVISVSTEFRKLYGERAADDLLFFIHSWSRLIKDLIHMGMPITSITFHMKAVITECIQHVETKRIKVSDVGEVRENFGNYGTDSLRVSTSEVYDHSVLNYLQKNYSVGKDSFNSLCADDRLNGDDQGTQKDEKTNDIMTEKDSAIVHHTEEIASFYKCTDTDGGADAGSGERETNKDSSSFNEDGIEVIHLENANSRVEEDEDTSWFFDDEEITDRISKINQDSKIVEQTERRIAEHVADADEMFEDEGNSDDSGAILTDIEKLKSDIENDLKKIGEKKERIKSLNVNVPSDHDEQSIGKSNTEVDEDFDSCFDSSDSEFIDCFEETDLKAVKGCENGKFDKSKPESSSDIEEFKTIELKFVDTLEKENGKILVSKTVPKQILGCQSVDIFNGPPSKVDVSLVNNSSSLGFELQMCQKEYLKTQEMLKSVKNDDEINCTRTELVENDTFRSSKNKSLEFESLSRHREFCGLQNTAKARTTEVVNKGDKNSFDHLRLGNCDRLETGKRSNYKGKLEEINSLLASVRKESKTDGHKASVSSLKFRSRHFQGTECEEAEQNRVAADSVQTKLCYIDKVDAISNEDTDSEDYNKKFPKSGISISCSTEMRDSKVLFSGSRSEQLSNFSQSLNFEKNTSVKAVENSQITLGGSHNCIDLKGINSMLKDINSISTSVKDSRKLDMQTPKSSEENGYICESENDFEMPDTRTRKTEELVDKPDIIGHVNGGYSQSTRKQSQSLQSSRLSNILLRSRHMNIDTDLTEKAELCKHTMESEPATQERSNLKIMNKQDATKCSAFSGNEISENDIHIEEVENEIENLEIKTDDEVLRGEVRRMVMGVNYDGDEDISTAVCDVVLRQSKDGKPRLKIDLVDCYSRASMTGSPEVIDGVIVEASIDTISLLQNLHGKQCRALLVNGDLTMNFKHKGYKPVKVKEFTSLERFTSSTYLPKFDSWLKDITHILEQLSVNVLLVKGNISEDVVNLCELLDIVAIDAIPYKQLVQLSEAAQADMLTYVTLATEDNVCTDLSISPWQQNWCDKMSARNCKQEVVISLAKSNPQTVVLCGITPMLTDLKEQELWDCLYHMASVMHSGYLVSGAGQTEEECVRFLEANLEILKRDQRSMWSEDLQYKQLVLESVISSFYSYVQLFKESELMPGYAMEGYNSKIETWKMAVDVSIILNNIDSFVTTGLTEDSTTSGTL